MKCEGVRKIVAEVDWKCEVKTLFRDENLGCGRSVSGSIDWFFENEEEGIILEDDCIRNATFFRFIDELLEKYREDDRVSLSSGSNFQVAERRDDMSYYFSKTVLIWGWATWRCAWRSYDF